MLGLHFCSRAFSSCSERGPLFIAVRRPLTVAASLVGEHRLQTRRLSSCGSRAQLLHSMWDPPRPGLEPVSPALAGRLSTTAPPGKPHLPVFIFSLWQPQTFRWPGPKPQPWFRSSGLPALLSHSTPLYLQPGRHGHTAQVSGGEKLRPHWRCDPWRPDHTWAVGLTPGHWILKGTLTS